MNAQVAPQSLAASATTFVKLGANGEHLPPDATGHLATLDTSTNLVHAVGVCPDELTEKGIEKLLAKLNADRYAGFDGWRLPTVKEGFSITDHTRYSPAADTSFFPDMKSDWYRTATPLAWSSLSVFCVLFHDGPVSYLSRYHEAFVRPVRSVSPGQ